VYVMCWTGCV